jgi:outer membrane biogenesis lipoprotein LolB
MNRKHNPMVALVALLLLAVLLLLVGCSAPAAAAPEEPETSPRFTVERHLSYGSHIDFFYIITDTETGVQYLWARDYYAGGLTVLQPAPEEVTTS